MAAEQVHTGSLVGDGIEFARPKETHDHERPKQDDNIIQEGNITSSTADPGDQLADRDRLKDFEIYGQNIQEGNIENDLVSALKKHQKEKWWMLPGHQMDASPSDDEGE